MMHRWLFAFVVLLLPVQVVAVESNPLDYTEAKDLTQNGAYKKFECHSTHETACEQDFWCDALEDSPTPPDEKGIEQPLVRFTIDLAARTLCMNDCAKPQFLPLISAKKRNDGLDMHWQVTLGRTKLNLVAKYPDSPKATRFYYSRTNPAMLKGDGRYMMEFGQCKAVK